VEINVIRRKSANGRFRVECLNQRWSMSLEDAREKMEAWRRYYNEERPHGAIGKKPPTTCFCHMAHPASHRDEAWKLNLA